MDWKRPTSVPYPNIWKEFDGSRKIDDKIPKFWIQDVAEDQFDLIKDLMLKGFVNDEPLCKYSKFAEDKVSVEEGTAYYTYILQQKLSAVCMTRDLDGKPSIVGVSCLLRISKDDQPLQPNGECYSRLRSLLDYAYSVKNPYTVLEIEECLSDRGIYVLPEYRGQGICLQFLKIWPEICKAVGLKAVVGSFTSNISQRAADKAGYQELNSFSYVHLGEINPKFKLPGIEEHTEKLKILYLLV